MNSIEFEMKLMKIKELEIYQQMNNTVNDVFLRINLAKGIPDAAKKWNQNNINNQAMFDKKVKEL